VLLHPLTIEKRARCPSKTMAVFISIQSIQEIVAVENRKQLNTIENNTILIGTIIR